MFFVNYINSTLSSVRVTTELRTRVEFWMFSLAILPSLVPESAPPSMTGEKVDIVPVPEGLTGTISVSSEDPSENDDYEPRCKLSKENDSLCVHTTDDVAQLLVEPSVQAKATNKPSDNVSKDEVLKELIATLQDEDKKGPKVQEQLADIAMKQWGNRLTSEKITSILG